MIELATIEDIVELNKLINSAYRGEHSKKGWTTETFILSGERVDEEELAAIINNPNVNIFKYVEQNIILGSVLLEIKVDKLYLGMLSVNPDLQNGGIGKKILAFADDFAVKNNCKIIEMTVISTRTELISWYNRNGYKDTGRREDFPSAFENDVIGSEKLQFVVLEKRLQ
jgi:ribosomal protein S18 acetylase RimI-like enzyme